MRPKGRERDSLRSLAIPFAMALLGHATLLAIVRGTQVPLARVPMPARSENTTEIEVLARERAGPGGEAAAARVTEHASKNETAAADAPTAPRATARPARSEGGGEPRGEQAGEAHSGDYEPLPQDRGLPGIDGRPLWAIPGAVAGPPRAPAAPTSVARRPVDGDAGGRAVRSTLAARGAERGTGQPAAYEASRAIEAVIMSAESPGESRARFEIRVGNEGKILDVRVTATSEGTHAVWERVKKRVVAAIAERRLELRGDAKAGATIVVDVVTKERFPNGSTSPVSVENLGAHKTRTVSSRVRVVVPGYKPFPERVLPVDVGWPWLPTPNRVPLDGRPGFAQPGQSGVVPLNPGDAYRKHPSE
jgi:hypothetical protein